MDESKFKKHKLNLIEPTLVDQTGHGYSYTTSILGAENANNFNFTVWLDKCSIDHNGKSILKDFKCNSENYFIRHFRQIQKVFLYNKLLSKQEDIFINTSEFIDLKILHILIIKSILLRKEFTSKVFLHFHQFNPKPYKLKFLNKISKIVTIANHFVFLAPTPDLINIFKTAGIKKAHVVPCSSYPRDTSLDRNNHSCRFDKVIFAGAARDDKGFSHVVELINYCASKNINIPFSIQNSPPNSGRYDHKTQKAINNLLNTKYPDLEIINHTLDQTQYLNLFKNSICLLLYDISQYHNKFSGVALDSVNCNAPIITSSNTWVGDIVQQYNAGVVVKDYTPISVLEALTKIISDYSFFSQGAFNAAKELSKTNNPKYTLELVTSYC